MRLKRLRELIGGERESGIFRRISGGEGDSGREDGNNKKLYGVCVYFIA